MKILKINNKDVVIKFTSRVITELNAKNITLEQLTADMEHMKVNNLYEAFYRATKDMNKINYDEALDLIDAYFEESEDNDTETFFFLVLEEYAKAMGMGKKFKGLLEEVKAQL